MFFVILFAGLLSSSLSLESNFYGEETCLSQKGYCVLEHECPASGRAEPESYKLLCPYQFSLGAICCKNFPMEELNCNQSHMVCSRRTHCPQNFHLGQKGCPKDLVCCALT